MKKSVPSLVHRTPSHAKRSPRLPQERDESTDSQTGDRQPIIEQARKDVARGLVDTDRGPVMDEVYNRHVKRTSKGK